MVAFHEKFWRPFILGLAIFIATFLLYLSNISAPFELDDHSNIVYQPRVMMEKFDGGFLWRAFTGRGFAKEGYSLSRGVTHATFALNYWMTGFEVSSWHITNNLLHALNALLLFLLLLRLWRERLSLAPTRVWVLAGLTLAWAFNPMHVQTVTYLVQRLTLLATSFTLLSLLGWLLSPTFKNVGVIFAVSGLWLLGCLSKEIALVAPFFGLLIFGFLLQPQQEIFKQRRYWVIAGVFLLVVIIMAIVFHGGFTEYWQRMLKQNQLPIGQRLATQLRVVWSYVGLLLYPDPARLTLDHYIAPSTHLFSPITSFFGLITIVASLIIAWGVRHSLPFTAIGVFWFFGGLVQESTFVPLELMFEHRAYLPSIGIWLMLSEWVLHFIGVESTHPKFSQKLSPPQTD